MSPPRLPIHAASLLGALRAVLTDALPLIENARPMHEVTHLWRYDEDGGSATARQELDPTAAVRLVARAQLGTARAVEAIVRSTESLPLLLLRDYDGVVTELSVWERVIGPFLGAFLREARAPAGESPVARVLEMVRQELTTGRGLIVELRPILNLDVSERVRISDSMEIRPARLHEIERWIGALPDFSLRGAIAVIETRYDSVIWSDSHDAYRPVDENAERLVTALQLHTGVDIRWVLAESVNRGVYGRTAGLRIPVPHLGPRPQIRGFIGRPDGQRLVEIIEALAGPRPASVDLALRRWADLVRRARADERLIDQWIALEALFTRGATSESRYRSALRIAAYVAETPEEATALYGAIMRSYDARSRVVHGGELAKIDVPGTAQQTHEWLRRSLLHALLEPASHKPEQIEAELLSRLPPRS
jgi:hypothetical protein